MTGLRREPSGASTIATGLETFGKVPESAGDSGAVLLRGVAGPAAAERDQSINAGEVHAKAGPRHAEGPEAGTA